MNRHSVKRTLVAQSLQPQLSAFELNSRTICRSGKGLICLQPDSVLPFFIVKNVNQRGKDKARSTRAHPFSFRNVRNDGNKHSNSMRRRFLPCSPVAGWTCAKRGTKPTNTNGTPGERVGKYVKRTVLSTHDGPCARLCDFCRLRVPSP